MKEDDNERNGKPKEESHESGDKSEKKRKKRQKKILADLKQQIEFYFSEPNLQKDRFLRQKIVEHPQGCVEITTIASFNRMTQLCSDVALVVKAMKMCPSVEVIDDQWVKPSRPLPEPKNVDSVTIYIEKLPPHADHDWIKSVFSSCGKVVYVSLPRYKSSRVIKGFAFVEFENENEAKRALEMFDQKRKPKNEDDDQGGERNVENDDEPTEKPEKKNRKRKRKSGELENEEEKAKGRRLKDKRGEETNDVTSDSSGTCAGSEKENTGGQKKRKRRNDHEISDENDHSIKLPKKNGEIKNEPNKRDTDSISTGEKRKRETSVDDDDDSTSNKKAKEFLEASCKDTELDENTKAKHKKRKRKKKEKREIDIPDLRVISKLEWLRLKQEYQKLQREAMKEAKMNLKKSEKSSTQNRNVNKEISDLSGNNTKMETHEKTSDGVELLEKLEMQPGVVLKYFTEETIDKKNLRDVFSAIAPVSYLEIQDDKEMGFVRFSTKQGCQKVVEAVKNGLLETVRVEELTEKEDTEYWKKLNADRIERFQQKKKRKKQRGTQKITEKFEAQVKKRDHIHFDE